jgi:hypothetical protein
MHGLARTGQVGSKRNSKQSLPHEGEGGQGTAVTHNPRADTYMQPLLGHAAKEGDLWHHRGKPEGKQQEHISIAMQNQPARNKLTPFYVWMHKHDIQQWISGTSPANAMGTVLA